MCQRLPGGRPPVQERGESPSLA
ncbi:hypothetical protein, partial [Streptomyces sp. H39-S7]